MAQIPASGFAAMQASQLLSGGAAGIALLHLERARTGAGRWQISRGGGQLARWSSRGNELIYRGDAGGESRLVSVRLSTTTTGLAADPPKDLMKLPDDLAELDAVGVDGERFLKVRRVAPQFAGDRIFEIVNWFDQVQEKVPSR